jgi:hypothetical protein
MLASAGGRMGSPPTAARNAGDVRATPGVEPLVRNGMAAAARQSASFGYLAFRITSLLSLGGRPANESVSAPAVHRL